MAVRILSELRRCPKGASPTALADRAGLSRPTLYVLLRRLAGRRCVVGRKKAQTVVYVITVRGLKERELFAKNVGLKP
jgi:DNA-binding IclR family transcriptional regulator